MAIGIDFYSLNVLRRPDDINLAYIHRRLKDKHRTKFVLLFVDEMVETVIERQLIDIFHQFWQRKVLHVLIAYWTTKLNCVTYSPFEKRFLVSLESNQTDSRKIFYDKAANMNGYELRVGMFYDMSRAIFNRVNFTSSDFVNLQGVDGLFTKLVIQHTNATLRLIQPTDGFDIGEYFSSKYCLRLFNCFALRLKRNCQK